MNCPICQVDLVMSDRQGIEIDYCPKCRGIWLDRGELDKIIERSGGFDAAPDTPQRPSSPQYHEGPPRKSHDDDYRHGHYGNHPKHKRGMRGFLEELFD